MTRRWQQWLGWAGVFAAYAAATLPVLLRYPPVFPDEVLFCVPAASLMRHSFLSSEVLAGFVAGMDRYYYWNPPFYFLLLAPALRVAAPHNYLLVIRMASWGLGVVFLIIGALILKRISGSGWVTWGTLVLAATHITFIQAANIGRMEMLTLACGGASVAAYLRAIDSEAIGWWVTAGMAGGLACVSHPAGGLIVAALVCHGLVTRGRRFFATRTGLAFMAGAATPLLAWLIYVAQAPGIFASQLGGQFIRKAAESTGNLAPEGILNKLLYPVQFGPMQEASHDWGFMVIVMVTAGLCATQVRRQAWFQVLGLWALWGISLNLVVHEVWYPVYFVVPVILLLGGCAATAPFRWARLTAVAMIMTGIASNVLQIWVLHGNEYLTWNEYRGYSSSISAQIPPGSNVLLAAIPDPYFGMLAEGKDYHFREFVPRAIPIEADLAEQTLNSTDYVVDSGCCRPPYLDNYIRAHGTLVAEFEVSGHAWPDIRIWRLRGLRARRGWSP